MLELFFQTIFVSRLLKYYIRAEDIFNNNSKTYKQWCHEKVNS